MKTKTPEEKTTQPQPEGLKSKGDWQEMIEKALKKKLLQKNWPEPKKLKR